MDEMVQKSTSSVLNWIHWIPLFQVNAKLNTYKTRATPVMASTHTHTHTYTRIENISPPSNYQAGYYKALIDLGKTDSKEEKVTIVARPTNSDNESRQNRRQNTAMIQRNVLSLSLSFSRFVVRVFSSGWERERERETRGLVVCVRAHEVVDTGAFSSSWHRSSFLFAKRGWETVGQLG